MRNRFRPQAVIPPDDIERGPRLIMYDGVAGIRDLFAFPYGRLVELFNRKTRRVPTE